MKKLDWFNSVKSSSQLLLEIDEYLTPNRDEQFLKIFKDGNFPDFVRHIKTIKTSVNDLFGEFYVLPDFLCIGNDNNWLYAPMGAITAEKVLALWGMCLPTIKMVNIIYDKSSKLVAAPWGAPYDKTMTSTKRWPVQTEKIKKQMKNKNINPGTLVEGHLKNVIVSNKSMSSNGTKLGFYGWFDAAKKRIQGDSLAHGAQYADYAHGVRGCLNLVKINNKFMSLHDALNNENYYKLFSDEKMPIASYLEVRRKHNIQTIEY